MTVRSAWHYNSPAQSPGQTRADTRLAPIGTMMPESAMTTRPGVIPGGTGLNLTGTGMTGTVAVGRAIVQGTSAQGAYPWAVTAAESFTVANGHASLPRIDSVFAVIQDQLYDASGGTLALLSYVQGTANAAPVAPTAPTISTNAYLKLWDIAVPAGASAGSPINWGTALTDRRVWTVAVGGILPGSSAVGAHPGQWRDNSGVLERYTGAAWESALRVASVGGQVVVGDVPLTRPSAGMLQVAGGLTVTGVGGFVTAWKTADLARISNTTVTPDPHLVLPVVANAQYILEGYLDYDGAFGAGGLKLDFTVPSGAIRWGGLGNVVNDTTQKYSSNTTTASSTLSFGTYGTGGTHTALAPRGWITTGLTAGNVVLRWAQDNSHATGTTLYTGSWLRLQRIA